MGGTESIPVKARRAGGTVVFFAIAMFKTERGTKFEVSPPGGDGDDRLLLIFGSLDMPDTWDPASPPSLHVSPRYIEQGFEETAVPNMVTAVLADYRSFDTLGEVTVIFTGALAVFSSSERDERTSRYHRTAQLSSSRARQVDDPFPQLPEESDGRPPIPT